MPLNVVSHTSANTNWAGVVTSISSLHVVVPSTTDLDTTNNRITDTSNSINKLEIDINNLESKIDDNTNAISEINTLQRSLQESLQYIISNERLEEEKKVLNNFFNELLMSIKNECNTEYNRIHKEVDAFKSIDLNTELGEKLDPIINTTNGLLTRFQQIIEYKDFIVEIEHRICKEKEILKQIEEERRKLKEEREISLFKTIAKNIFRFGKNKD